MSGVSPITVVSWNEFIADPSLMYNLFSRNTSTGQLNFDPARVIVMSDEKRRLVKVNTVEELALVERDFLSKPILLHTTAVHSKTDNYVYVRVTTRWKGDFAVLLNPLNPMVREAIERMFQQAIGLMCEGKRFCLEFDLGPCICAWYSDMLDASGCYTSTNSAGSRIAITNASKYEHCFDCNALWCSLGFLCWCLSAPCYMTYRACTVSDLQHTFDLPIVMRTPLARNLVVELIPERSRQSRDQNRRVLNNRVVQVQNMETPEVFAPERQTQNGPPPPMPPGAAIPPPPYSPPAYDTLEQPVMRQPEPHAIPPPPQYQRTPSAPPDGTLPDTTPSSTNA